MNLGDKVKDIVTGFTGIITAKTTFLNGCVRVSVQSDKLKDGIPTDPQWFDEPQVRIVKPNAVSEGSRDTGGPMPFLPRRQQDAKR